jgi:hypothetical protein
MSLSPLTQKLDWLLTYRSLKITIPGWQVQKKTQSSKIFSPLFHIFAMPLQPHEIIIYALLVEDNLSDISCPVESKKKILIFPNVRIEPIF